MESVGGVGHVTVNDNRSMTINVMDEATRDRVLRIATRTRKIESTGTSVMSTSKLIETVSEDENVGGDNATETSERE